MPQHQPQDLAPTGNRKCLADCDTAFGRVAVCRHAAGLGLLGVLKGPGDITYLPLRPRGNEKGNFFLDFHRAEKRGPFLSIFHMNIV